MKTAITPPGHCGHCAVPRRGSQPLCNFVHWCWVIGYPGRALFYSTRALQNSTQPPTRVCGPIRSKNTALGVLRTPGGVLGTCFVL